MQRLRSLATARRSATYEWGFTAIAFLAAFGSRYWLEGALPPGFPYLTFFPAVILTGFFAGTRAGTVVAVLCGLSAWYFFLAPQGSWGLTGSSVLALVFYVFIVATDLVLLHLMRLALVKLDDERKTSDRLAAQNKTMFHELQHRVSNNLQVIASLLKMQQRNLADGAARQALETASARLKVVASIQRQLHNPKRQNIDIAQLLKAVLPEVLASADVGDRVVLDFQMQPLIATGDQATPVALVAVELTSNALEHALSEDRVTRITISTGTENGEGFVRIADDGKGLPEDFQPEKSRSLGLRVAFQFADQLDGKLGFQSGPGTVATLTFPATAIEPAEA
ncbi:sensor histidine kinase [Pseudotabrizicola sp. L79]|uniref:sensor histidine kinase n=1 Tax=Pseudotabrizicola sp. L79 TaxID=3118402 RepID=UPI002F954C48